MLYKVVRQDKQEILVRGDYATLEGDVFKCYQRTYLDDTPPEGVEKGLVACIPEADYFTSD